MITCAQSMNPMFVDASMIDRSGASEHARRRMILDIAGACV